MNEKKIQVRAAEHSDYEVVMRFSYIYGGRDYLPQLYHVFLHDSSFHSFVITLNGRVVGYQTNKVVGGESAYYKMGVRVAAECRGLGLSKILADQSEALLLKRVPGISHVIWIARDYPVNHKMLEKYPDICLQDKFNFLPYDMTLSDFRKIPFDARKNIPVDTISQLNLSQSIRLLTDPTNQKRFFTNGYIIPPISYDLITADTRGAREAAMKFRVTASFTSDGSTCESVAFSSLLLLSEGVTRLDVWIHGEGITAEVVAAQILVFLKSSLKVVGTKVLKFVLLFPAHVDKSEVESHLVDTLGAPLVNETFTNCYWEFMMRKEIKRSQRQNTNVV